MCGYIINNFKDVCILKASHYQRFAQNHFGVILVNISEHCESFDSNNMETVGGWAHQNGDQKDFDIYDVDHDYHDYHDHDFTKGSHPPRKVQFF